MKKTMKTAYILLGAALLLGGTALTSCDDKLSELPKQYKVDGNAVVDQKSAQTLLNGMYYTYVKSGTDNYDQQSTQCDMYYSVLPADFAGLYKYYQGDYMFEQHGSTSVTSYSSYFWTTHYSTVNAANCVIDQVTAANDSWFAGNKKKEILGEAYGMRALAFYNLLRLCGYSWDVNSPYGIILRTQSSKVSNSSMPRSSVKDTYAQILSDCDYAIQNAPSENEHYYITRWFAEGLKARVLMLRGADGDYAAAAELAKDVIDNSPYALEDNVMDVFKTKGVDSQEVIFGIKPYDKQTNVYENYFYRGEPQYLPTDNFVALFNDDPRKDKVLGTANVRNIHWNDDGTYSWVYEPAACIGKFVDIVNNTTNTITESQYDMRLTEMYLLRAEALVRCGGDMTEARSLLKTVLTHAGYTDVAFVDVATSSDALLKLIFDEDIRNLFGEGGREIDFMLRFGSIATDFNSQYENAQYNVFPIPTDEFKYNSLLTKDMQNPGYSAE